ncbi:hypothetical protein FHL15_008032 [Xylaria flabelliformis]|uniref:Zn(2)-C6 fungal-type domain-containing protein n=1 Tax=Xylaria flabelliformis TaxID=2512241 RepID=A0A553HSW8_9PEZI|nr:hypothetical protein FHL15_008032 [Xylaria flabelliformis]
MTTTMVLPNRKACDQCHDLKLACRRINGGQCERCSKADQPCTSSPSLRHRKKRFSRPREPRYQSKPLPIRPAPPKGRDSLLPPRRGLCDSMSQLQQTPTRANPSNEPQVDEGTISPSGPRSSNLGFPTAQGGEFYRIYNQCHLSFINHEDVQQTPLAAEVGPRYLEPCLSRHGLSYNQFQDTISPRVP